jgi:hypothetical protein
MLNESEVAKLVNTGLFKPEKYKVIKSSSRTCLVVCLMKTDKNYYYIKLIEFFHRKTNEWGRSESNLNTLPEVKKMIMALTEYYELIANIIEEKKEKK